MLGVIGTILVVLFTILVPLSLCVVPSLARLTIFPLLTSIIYRFTSGYVQSCLSVEFGFGEFEVKARGNHLRKMLRGVSLSLFYVKLQEEFLKTLNFAKQGVAPVVLTGVSIREVTLYLASSWKVVLKINDVNVNGVIVDPNVVERPAFELSDAITMKLNEAGGYINQLITQKLKNEEEAANSNVDQSAAPKKFGFKDRVVQLMLAQVDVQLTHVKISITGEPPLSAVPEAVESEDAKLPTRVRLGFTSAELLTFVKHDDPDEALDLVLSSNDIRVEHDVSIKDLTVFAAKVTSTTDQEDNEQKKSSLKSSLQKPKDPVGPNEVALLSVTTLHLKVDVPPMPRALGIVENIAPIPLDKRVAHVEVSSANVNRISVADEYLTSVFRDLYVPFSDHQVLVKSLRLRDAEDSAQKKLSGEDLEFYLANFDKVDNNKKLSADEKKTRNDKLHDLEASLSLNEIVKLRSRALKLPKYFGKTEDDAELTVDECNAIIQENAAKVSNIMFKTMEILLQLENLSVSFVEANRQIAEIALLEFGVQLISHSVPAGDEKLIQDIDLKLGQLMFMVHSKSLSSLGSISSPVSKLIYADFRQAAISSDAVVTRPKILTARVSRYLSGKQVVDAGLNHLQLILAAEALEYFLMSVDRLNSNLSKVMSAARPPIVVESDLDTVAITIKPEEKEDEEKEEEKEEDTDKSTKVTSMAPFSVLGGKILQFDITLDDCHIKLTPSRSFATVLYTDVDVSQGNDNIVSCRVDVPISLRLRVDSSLVKEMIELNVTNLAIDARYIEGTNDSEAILVPASFMCRFTLEQDAKNPLLCHQNMSLHMPDFVLVFSDLSLALMVSCVQSLSSIQTTTEEQALIKLESQLKAEEMRRQAELDLIMGRLRRLFDEIDTDKNGHIELSELLMLLRRVNVGDTLLESELEYFVRVLFQEIDRDGNGFLEFDELRAFLHNDLFSSDPTSPTEYDGSSHLTGSLNLRGAEYRSVEVLEKLTDTKVSSMEGFEKWLERSVFQARFWDLYEKETAITDHTTFGGQSPLDLQKKVVRLLKNYDAAKLCWEKLILPALSEKEKELGLCGWLLQPYTPCGGIAEYQNAASVIAKKRRNGIFAAALNEAEQLVQIASQKNTRNAIKKQLVVATDIKLGNLRFVLTDAELPSRYSRGDFIIQKVKVSVDLSAKEIDEHDPVDWVALATSGTSEWTALFGVHLIASCYSDLAADMENVIEPWELVAGLSSSEGENGFSTLVEASKRLQINVTPGLLHMYRVLMEVMDGKAEATSLQKHHETLQTTLIHKGSRRGAECVVQNLTGCKVVLHLNGDEVDKNVEVDANGRKVMNRSALIDGKAVLSQLQIDEFGKSTEKVELPSCGSVNVAVISDSQPPTTLFVTVSSRLEDPFKQRIVLKSNLFFCNHSSEIYELTYLRLGSEGHAAINSPVIRLRPNERIALPTSLLMGITEIYARPEHFDLWIVKATLNNDVLTSKTAIDELFEHQKSREAKNSQRRGGAIVYGDTAETSTKIVKQLTPNVVIRRWHLRTHFEWELSLLPPFVVRNSLPYKIEYRFIEYKQQSSKNVTAEFGKLEALLSAEGEPSAPNANTDNTKVLSGVVEAGQEAEVSGVSCLCPGYLSVRLVMKKKGSNAKITSPWSKAMLMAIHGSVEQFTTSRETVQLGKGLQFSVDRLTLPNFPRLVRFVSPYWIINNTSFDFSCASPESGTKASSIKPMEIPGQFNYPIITALPKDRLSLKPIAAMNMRPDAWDYLGNIPDTAYTLSSVTEDALKRATWSEPMNTTAINTIGECACGPSVFAVKVEGLYGLFEQSVALTLSPRYFIQNRLNEKLFLQTFSCSEDDPEKVDDLFHKRSEEQVRALQVGLENGETMPAFHFAPLKKGDTVSSAQKFISVSFSESWGGDNTKCWSFAIPVNAASDLYIQMYSPTKKRHLICQASVQVVEMYVYVILSDVSSSPPYRIENYTPFTIECAQLGESSIFGSGGKETSTTIKPGEWNSFAWYNPLSKEHEIELTLSHRDAPQRRLKKYDIDHVGYQEPINMKLSVDGGHQKNIEVAVQVIVDESTRVLKVIENELVLKRFEDQDAQFEHEFQQRKMLFASSFDIRVAGLGLSLFDSYPQEVFAASVDLVQLQKPPSSLEWTFSIFHCQLDNMLTTAKFPVILNPVDSGYSDKSTGKKPEPLIKLVTDADITAKIGIYKLFELQLHELSIKVDVDYIVSLVKLVDPYLISDTTVANRSIRTLDTALKRRVPPVPVMELTPDGNIRRDLVYFDLLRIHSTGVDLEYSITRKDIAGDGSGRSVIFGFLSQIIGLIGSNLSGSPTFNFSEIVITRCFSTKQRLQSQLIQNFIRQAVLQAYRLIGSADIIGNPIGLVEDLGSGVLEFLKITKGEVLGDSQTRGEGVKVLGKTIIKSGTTSIAKITGTLDKFVGEFADTDDQGNSAGDVSGAQESESSGIAGGGIKFAKDLGKGLTGIFTKPIEGAKKGGVVGLVQGTVSGIAGPGVVLLKGLTSTSNSLVLGVQSTVLDRSPFGGRRRLPKTVENNKVISEFDATHYKPTRMTVEVLSASGLLSDSSCDPLCVVRVDEKVILRTRVLYNTLNPVWQEKTELAINGNEDEVQFVVKDSYGGAVDKTIGKCILSMQELQDDFKPPEYSSNLAEWVDTGIRPDDTKKNVSHQVKEREYPLVLPSSKRGKSFFGAASGSDSQHLDADENYQVLVTIIGLHDMKIKNSSGGGMLGLGNLVGSSSTPNISPYISIHVGKGANRTNTAKITFMTVNGNQVANAEWKETFTYTLTQKDLTSMKENKMKPCVTFSLKDKNMIRDDYLGHAIKDLDLSTADDPTSEEDVRLTVNKDGSGEFVGCLKVKVEVVSATATTATPRSSRESKSSDGGSEEASTPNTPGPNFLGGVKAGKIRVACEFK